MSVDDCYPKEVESAFGEVEHLRERSRAVWRARDRFQ